MLKSAIAGVFPSSEFPDVACKQEKGFIFVVYSLQYMFKKMNPVEVGILIWKQNDGKYGEALDIFSYLDSVITLLNSKDA